MKTKSLALVGGCCAPLLVAATASAAFTGLSTETRSNAFGIDVIGVYANFDAVGDSLTIVAGTPLNPLSINVVGGTFYQHTAGSDRAPIDAAVGVFPSLAYDTFVTIGVSLVDPDGNDGGQPLDLMFLSPTWSGFGPSSLFSVNDFWSAPPAPIGQQGNPFNPGFDAGDGRTLIGQFATTDGSGFEGSMLLQGTSGGVPFQTVANFSHTIPTPGALALIGVAGLATRRRRRS
jgi:uncharacterized protein (TIGR03382 family)